MRSPSVVAVVCLLGSVALPARGGPVDPRPGDAPAAAWRDLDGTVRSVEELRGRIVVLNFWATWCLPCREEMPIILAIHDRYADRGVSVVAASTDETAARDTVMRFVREQRIDVPVWTGATVEDMRSLGLGDAIPATAILDSEGTIAFRIRGMATRDLLEERIEFLLADAGGAVPAREIDRFEVEPEGHDHEGEEAHDHGGEGAEGSSLVPS